MLVDNLLADPQPKSGSYRTFGGEKRLEELFLRTRTDAFAIVSYCNSNAAAGILGVDARRDSATAPKRPIKGKF
jgi:hypothetical protein